MGYANSPNPKRFFNALVDVHGNYRSSRQTHEPPDELISDEVTSRVLRPHIARSSFFLIAMVVTTLAILLCLLLSAVTGVAESFSSFGSSRRQDGGASDVFGGLAVLLSFVLMLLVVAWIIALFVPVHEPIAEYGLLIEGRAQVATVAYWWISQTIAGRQAPFDVRLGRVRRTPVMLLAHGRTAGLIVVQAHGADLYMGWTMWRSRSTMVVIGNSIRDMAMATGIGRLQTAVRAASTRAMRELIHSVTREGVQAAIINPPVPVDAAHQVELLPDLDMPTPPGKQPDRAWPGEPRPPVPHQQAPAAPVHTSSPITEPQP